MSDFVASVPWFLPGVGISIAVAIATSRRLGGVIHTCQPIAAAMIMAFGIVIAATLTPLTSGAEAGGSGIWSCDLSRIGPAPLSELTVVRDASLNVLLFLPAGVVLGLLPRSTIKLAVIGAAIALPFAIETIQPLLPLFGRACESSDVVDNLTGLVLGLAIGTVGGLVARWVVRLSARGAPDPRRVGR